MLNDRVALLLEQMEREDTTLGPGKGYLYTDEIRSLLGIPRQQEPYAELAKILRERGYDA